MKTILDETLKNKKSRILVRGDNSKAVLKNFGYDSDQIISFGCPAIFLVKNINVNQINDKISNIHKFDNPIKIVYYPSYFSNRENSDLYNLKVHNSDKIKTFYIIQSAKLIEKINQHRNGKKINIKPKFKTLDLNKCIYILKIYTNRRIF